MSTSHEYNGWTNYETWAVNLWLSNEEGTYRYWLSVAEDTFDNAEADAPFTKIERATLDLADMMKAELVDGDERPLADEASLYSDLLSAALSEVNWYEIASGWLEDAREAVS